MGQFISEIIGSKQVFSANPKNGEQIIGKDIQLSATGITIIANDKKYTLKDAHQQDCCENVYADWDNMAYYPTVPISNGGIASDVINIVGNIESPDFIESVDGVGFKFKCEQGYILVSCYNIQNGYYSNNLTISCSLDGKELWSKDVSDCTKFIDT